MHNESQQTTQGHSQERFRRETEISLVWDFGHRLSGWNCFSACILVCSAVRACRQTLTLGATEDEIKEDDLTLSYPVASSRGYVRV